MRYRLRTLLIVLALGPPMLAAAYPVAVAVYVDWQQAARKPQIQWETLAIDSGACRRQPLSVLQRQLDEAERKLAAQNAQLTP